MTTQTKERPIIFSAEMIRAILDGRKTVTRRVIVPNKRWADEIHLEEGRNGSWIPYNGVDDSILGPDSCEHPIPCPYGVPCDKLWVRETWWSPSKKRYPNERVVGLPDVIYAADYPKRETHEICSSCGHKKKIDTSKRFPSIHMPRWASRITLKVVSVRVERLQDITEEDALREGARGAYLKSDPKMQSPAKEQFKHIWNSINGPDTWKANAWVWRIEFEVIK